MIRPRHDGPRSALEAAYRATDYIVDGPAGTIVLRAGAASAALDRLLAAEGASRWVFLTAANPGSRRRPAAENARRRAALGRAIARLGLRAFAGRSVADAGDWEAEESFLVLGIERAAALALARRFGQAAILAGERGGAAELLWCDERGRPT